MDGSGDACPSSCVKAEEVFLRSSGPRVDVLVLGAGPAGLAAACWLAHRGHRVEVRERNRAPARSPGEALTPGVWPTIEALEARECLRRVPMRPDGGAVIAWEQGTPQQVPARPGHVVVDRSQFDGALLQLAAERGVVVVCGHSVHEPRSQLRDAARVVVDARGRSRARTALAPATLALWVDLPERTTLRTTMVEACPNGWLWASPLPSGSARLMGFVDAGSGKGALRALLGHSRYIAPQHPHTTQWSQSDVRGCDCTPSLGPSASSAHRFCAGDAAFSLDPLSSTGVERALRSGLHVATAVHTLLRGGSPEMCHAFVQQRMEEALVEHLRWTRGYYQRAWCDGDFWKRRASGTVAETGPGPARHILERSRTPLPAPLPVATWSPAEVAAAWTGHLSVSEDLRVTRELSVVDDQVVERPALVGAGLQRPLAFVDGYDAVALLEEARDAGRLPVVVDRWSRRMPRAQAGRLAAWFVEKGLLVV